MTVSRWVPPTILAFGAVALLGAGTQRAAPLAGTLEGGIDTVIAGHHGRNVPIPQEELDVAGVTAHLFRIYGLEARSAFSVYIGYYDRQTSRRTVHSPKNCLPGAGWEIRESGVQSVAIGERTQEVNRTIVQRGDDRALVLYWYQGRGRLAHNEYAVKWHLLRDAMIRRRTEEALVRIVVPLGAGDATQLAAGVAAEIIPALDAILPAAPGPA